MYNSLLAARSRPAFQHSVHAERIEGLAATLSARGCRPSTVQRYLNEWADFVAHCDAGGRELPADMSDPAVLAYLELRDEGRKERNRHARAALRALVGGQLQRRRLPSAGVPTTALFDSCVPAYLDFLSQHRGRRGVRGVTEILRQFFAWLARSGIDDLEAISPTHVQDHLAGLVHLRRSTIAGHASGLRCFLRYLGMRGVVAPELALSVDSPRIYQMSDLPPVLDVEAVARILEITDRSTAMGRRDYAMLILAARYGMRPCDIRGLRLGGIRWRQCCIMLVQAKTQQQLELPLLDDVADALVDYLQHGRPATDAREVFVGHRPPFRPLSQFNCLWDVMDRAFLAARIAPPAGRRGLYLLRHSAATNMLSRGAPFDVISDILGHASAETTRIYAKVDLVHLRSVALSEAEVRS